MVNWFGKCAPIKKKFQALIVVETLWALMGLVGGGLTVTGFPVPGISVGIVPLAGTTLTLWYAWYAGSVVTRPYVATAERTEVRAMDRGHQHAIIIKQNAGSQERVVETPGRSAVLRSGRKVIWRSA